MVNHGITLLRTDYRNVHVWHTLGTISSHSPTMSMEFTRHQQPDHAGLLVLLSK